MSEPSDSPSARESDIGSRSVIGLLRRGRHMAQVALAPNNHRRHRHGGDLTLPQPSRPHSSLSFTSLGGQQQRPHSSLNTTHLNGSQHGLDIDEDGGAEIPDIPLKRPSRQHTSEQQALKPSRIDETWGEEDNNDWRPQRPINPNNIPSHKDRLCVLRAPWPKASPRVKLMMLLAICSLQRAFRGEGEGSSTPTPYPSKAGHLPSARP